MRSSDSLGKPLTRGVARRHSRTRDVHKILIGARFRRAVLTDLRATVAAASAPALTIALAVAVLILATAASAASEGVLVIHSNQRATPAAIVIENTLGRVVPEQLGRPVELYSEYLDIEWASTETYAAAQAEFLRQKYAGRNIRVIVAAAPAALGFAIRHRDSMLPGVPVVHIAVAKDSLDQASLPPGVVGKTIDLDPTQTLELALRLQPGAKRLVLVLGAAERDRVWERRLRKAAGQLEAPVEAEFLVGLPTEDVLRRLAALTKDTIVFTPGYFLDGGGRVATPRQVVERIAPASAAAVYGPLDTFLGTGIVGGYVAPYEEQSRQAADIVVRLLNGTPPAAIAASSIANVPVIDWRALRRWGIDERLLPAGTIVRFREPTLWETHWREISLGFAIFLFQAALIAALLIERRSRHRVAHALEESEKQMSLAAHAARLSTWLWDVAGTKAAENTKTRWSNGQPKDPPIDFNVVLESVHPADRDEVERAVRQAVAKDEELDAEYRVVRPGGEVRWIQARGRAQKESGERMLGVALDVTERKFAELRAAEDRTALRYMTRVSTLGQLSASIAHQLNQPLAAILGNAEAARKMLGRERVDLAELREICDDIVSDDNRAAEVIRRLGALYKRGDMKTELLDLNDLIRETLELLRTELLTRHLTPVPDLAPGLPPIEAGRVQLQQVMLNLFLNAADAMSGIEARERRLAIRTELSAAPDSQGVAARMYVSDNGSGIAVGDLKNVFEAFWTTKPGGMGIGLAICRSIVNAHHGSITATNNAERGATFCVTLPVKDRA
jgi:PAS domain S-box-containing protein